MSIEANKAIFRRFYEDSWSHGDLSAIDDLVSPDFVNHELKTPGDHKANYRQAVPETRTAFPDWTVTVDLIIAEGEYVVGQWHASGTHTGAEWGMPPTGQKVVMQGITIVRIVDGLITDFWKRDDSYTVPQQLSGESS